MTISCDRVSLRGACGNRYGVQRCWSRVWIAIAISDEQTLAGGKVEAIYETVRVTKDKNTTACRRGCCRSWMHLAFCGTPDPDSVP